MKKSVVLMVLTISLLLFTTSCATKVFTTNDLNSNYLLNMGSEKKKGLVEKIKVYYSEKEIGNNFSVISINRYNPFTLPWPLGNYDKKVKKKSIEKAVKKANSQKGDAVLIVDETHYKVIQLK